MCRPTYYTIAYEINPWMRLARQAAQPTAARQWERLHRLLTERLKVRVTRLPPVRGLPDLVFTANAGLVVGRLPTDPAGQAGTIIRSNFRYAQRQGEEAVIERHFAHRGFRVVRLPRSFNFEGEGDALWMGDTLVLGFRFRSDANAHERLARLVRREVLPVELIDRRFYHLDTCFCPLDDTSALWYPKAFDRYGRRVIERLVARPVAVSTRDALRFCCNAIVVPAPPNTRGGPGGRTVVMQRGASKNLRRRLEANGCAVQEIELGEFLKAGGSAKCLVLRLG